MRFLPALAALLLASPAFAADTIDCTVDGAAFKPVKITAGVVKNEQLMGPGRWLSIALENDKQAAIGIVANWDKLEAAKLDTSGSGQEGPSAPFQATWRAGKNGAAHILVGPWKAKVEKVAGIPVQAAFDVDLELRDLLAMVHKTNAPPVKVKCKGTVAVTMNAQ